MITTERQATSKLVALDEDSTILGYSQTYDPDRFLRELAGGSTGSGQVRIYEVCPPAMDDTDHYYDFEATCLRRRDMGPEPQH
jgi:hypothetical protein